MTNINNKIKGIAFKGLSVIKDIALKVIKNLIKGKK